MNAKRNVQMGKTMTVIKPSDVREELELDSAGRNPRFADGRWLGAAIVVILGICAGSLTYTAIVGSGELVAKVFAAVFWAGLGLAMLAAMTSAIGWRKIIRLRRTSTEASRRARAARS
jgi:hypothetical protein